MSAIVAASLVTAAPPLPGAETPAEAASASQFEAGNIVSDGNFYAGSAMSASSVLAFLRQQLGTCDAGYTCLPDYAQATPTMAANRYCAAIPGQSSESAASIIARVGQACNISQRVLLVLVQKEQSLVTDRNPTARQFSAATGFACPDTAPCDSSFGGFFYQIYYAARQFNVYKTFPTSYNHQPGAWNNVLYHPNAACGSGRVFIQNSATAGLYNYTPYQPNGAAMANLYGTGDACSAYGNRNFWRMWSDWFGDPRGTPTASGSPFGVLESTRTTAEFAELTGFAMDPSQPTAPINVNVYLNGTWNHTTRADRDSASAGGYAGYGRAHGFSVRVPISSYPAEVCIAMLNLGAGADVWLGCSTVQRPTGLPFGQVDNVSLTGRIADVSGWSIEPDIAPAANGIHYYVNGRMAGASVANLSRPDVGRVIPGWGADHGYAIRLPLAVGSSEICVYAISSPLDDNPLLGCRTVATASGPPVGQVDSMTSVPGGVRLSGWALDPDTPDAVRVQVLVDGQLRTTLTANQTRADVGRAFPGYGDGHGYTETIQLSAGTRRVCLVVENVRVGSNASLGCRDVSPGGGPAIGRIDSATVDQRTGQISLSGWVIDPDTVDPVSVEVLVDGVVAHQGVANQTRPDIARVYPDYGASHGMGSLTARMTPGIHTVCVRAIDQPGGVRTQIGCTRLSMSGSPVGRIDSLSVSSAGSLQVNGWAIDPDTSDPIGIWLYVDGELRQQYSANAARPDVGRIYTAYGANHGLESANVPLTPGRHQACAWAINVGEGASTLLGCGWVTR